MPSISPGAIATVPLATGEYLVLDGICSAQVVSAMPPNVDTSIKRFSVGGTMGPYPAAGTVQITAGAQEPVAYDIDGPGVEEGNGGGLTAAEVAAVKTAANSLKLVEPDLLRRCTNLVGVTTGNSGTAATVTVDSASPFGASAIKVACPAGNVWADIIFAVPSIPVFDDHIGWRVWISDATKVDKIWAFTEQISPSRNQFDSYKLNGGGALYNGEHIIHSGPLRKNGGGTFVYGSDTLGQCRLRIWPVTGQACDVWVERIALCKRQKPTVVFTFDDGSPSWITYVKPLLKQYGFVASFGVNTGSVPGLITYADLQGLIGDGSEVSSHNILNTNITTAGVAPYAADFVAARGLLSANLGGKVYGGYHPWVQGVYSQLGIDAMRAAGLEIARGVATDHNIVGMGIGSSVYELRVYNASAMNDAAVAIQYAQQCAQYGTLVVYEFHDVVTGVATGSSQNLAAMQALFAAVAALGESVQIKTMGQLYAGLKTAGYVPPALL